MKKILALPTFFLTNLGLLASTFTVWAADVTVPTSSNCTNIECLYGKFVEIMNWVFAFAIVIAVILIIIGGVQYMTAGGDDEKIKKAKAKFIWGLVGVAIVVSAWVIVAIIAAFVGVDNVNAPEVT